jgi:hypothetical protein
MTHRQAAIWMGKIDAYERANGTSVWGSWVVRDGQAWYVVVYVGGEYFRLYTADECRIWITDRY